MTPPLYIGVRLRKARALAQMTQAELAAAAGLEPAAVAHFEADRRSPSLKNFRALCDALDADPRELLGL